MIDQQPTAPTMKWSAYQEAIFEHFNTTDDNILVDAVAGSGKTTTIVELSRRVAQSKSVIFCAFGRDIVMSLEDKVGANTTCKTINAIGHGALHKYFKGEGKRLRLDDYKYRGLVDHATDSVQCDDVRALRQAVISIVSFAQSTLSATDDESLDDLCAHYGIELPVDANYPAAWYYDVARWALGEGERVAKVDAIISFNDQLWLPTLWKLPMTRYDIVFVDEVQDLSRAKLEIVLRSKSRYGRIIGVGDPYQSIMGFAGADPRAWAEILERTGAKVLPLSVCYRCPKNVLAVAQTTVPHIEAADDAIDGTFARISLDTFYTQVNSGDLVLCRYTAPLIKTCISLIRAKKPARVKGRDIAKQLLTMAKDALKGGKLWSEFPTALTAFVTRESAKLSHQKGSELRIQALHDRAEGLLACYEAFSEATSFEDFAADVQELFVDTAALINLSTIHKAKGLQARNVFTLAPKKLGREQKLDWQTQQERNLKYVNDTRAQEALYYVETA